MSQTPIDPTKIGRGFTRQTFTYDQAGNFYHVEPSKSMQEQNNPIQTTDSEVTEQPIPHTPNFTKVAEAVSKINARYHSLNTIATALSRALTPEEEHFYTVAQNGRLVSTWIQDQVPELELDILTATAVAHILVVHEPMTVSAGSTPFAYTEEDARNFFMASIGTLKAIETAVVDNSKDQNAGAKAAAKILSEAKGDAPKVAVVNGVEVMALKDVETPDGVKPFADGNIVGVFDQDGEAKSIEERLGQPDEFITKALKKAGVPHPGAWMVGMNHRWTLSTVDVKQRIFHINQQLRLYIAEIATDHSSTIQPRATIVDGVSVEDWYKIISAGILKYMADLMIEHQERVAKAAAEAPATPAA